MSLLRELFEYARARKRMWLLPVILLLLTIGAVLVVAQGSVLAPFVYTLF